MSDSGKTDGNLSPSETVRNELSGGDNPTPGIGRGRGTRRGRGRGAALQPEARPRTRSSSKNKKNQDEPEAQLASPNSSKAGSGRVVIPANDVFNSSSENLSAPSRSESPDPPPTAQEYRFGDVPPQQGLLDGPRLLVPPENERNQGVSRSDPEIRNGNANPRVPTDTPAILLGMKNRQQAFQSRIEEQAMRLSRIEKLSAQIEKIQLNQGNVLNSHANRLDVVENDVRYVSAQAAEVKSQTRELSQSVAHHSECIDNLTGLIEGCNSLITKGSDSRQKLRDDLEKTQKELKDIARKTSSDGSVFWKRDQVGSRRWQEGAEASSPGEERSPEVEEASLGPHGRIRGEVGAGRAAAASAAREASGKNCPEGEALGQEGASSPRENAETRRCEETSSDLLQNGVYPQKEGNSMFSAATTECDVGEGIAGAEQLIEEIIKAILPHLNKLLLARRQFENKRRIVDFKRRVLLVVEHEGVSLPSGPLSHKFRTAYRLVHARNPPPDDMLLAEDDVIGNGSDNEGDASDVTSNVAEPRNSDEEDNAEIDWCAVEPESVEERYIEAESYSAEPEQSGVEERSGPCYPENSDTRSSSSELDSDVSYEFTYEEEEDINRPVRVLTPTAETYSPTAELFRESSHRNHKMSLEYRYDEAMW
ncbi:hypothetical protein QAD02_003111 [Eretmocerus hayati]|uniref:Uncharacterized protein n=1 Tax=Eretmocerus hayati TaxID=131215 RepID=A0ACC2NL69_9HYME|nr:hypothetical protein QAD02_003111 [Eretmocerus hayati]